MRLDFHKSIRPVFQSAWTGYAILLTLASFVALPIGMGLIGVPLRQSVYEEIPVRGGPYSFIRDQIYVETSDIDVLFIGASLIHHAVDPLSIRDSLRPFFKREPVVLNLGSSWRGEEVYFVLLHELLKKRRVNWVILEIPAYDRDSPHEMSRFFWDSFLHWNEIISLPWKYRLALYAESVLGGPRHLLSLIRPNKELTPESKQFIEKTRDNLGRFPADYAWRGEANNPAAKQELVFKTYDSPVFQAREMLYTGSPHPNFQWDENPPTPFQGHFMTRVLDLVDQHGGKFAMMSIPRMHQRLEDSIAMRRYFNIPKERVIPWVGIPPKRLLAHFDEKTLREIYYDDNHLNTNGARFFSRTIASAIVSLTQQKREIRYARKPSG